MLSSELFKKYKNCVVGGRMLYFLSDLPYIPLHCRKEYMAYVDSLKTGYNP